MDLDVVLVIGIALALIFDFTNGYNDSASLVAAVVASRAMGARKAMWFAAAFELAGPLVVGTAVAGAIGGILVPEPGGGSVGVVTVALTTAIAWNAFAAAIGMPTSSSHALVGSQIGAQLLATGSLESVHWGIADFDPLRPHGVLGVFAALLISPILGLLAGFLLHRGAMNALRGATPRVTAKLRRLQVGAAAMLAFSHGSNDAQKTMGVITLLLVSSGHLSELVVPTWVKIAAACCIATGVVAGGRRILRTVGRGIVRMRPIHGLSAQGASALVILGGSLLGGPVSTPHVVSSSVMGVGASSGVRRVRWGRARRIVASWLVTIPATAGTAALLGTIFRLR